MKYAPMAGAAIEAGRTAYGLYKQGRKMYRNMTKTKKPTQTTVAVKQTGRKLNYNTTSKIGGELTKKPFKDLGITEFDRIGYVKCSEYGGLLTPQNPIDCAYAAVGLPIQELVIAKWGSIFKDLLKQAKHPIGDWSSRLDTSILTTTPGPLKILFRYRKKNSLNSAPVTMPAFTIDSTKSIYQNVLDWVSHFKLELNTPAVLNAEPIDPLSIILYHDLGSNMIQLGKLIFSRLMFSFSLKQKLSCQYRNLSD
jgi:hypothetical protein